MHICLGADSVGMSVVKSNFQYQLFVVSAFAHHEEHVGTAAAREPPLDDQAVIEAVTGTGCCWIDRGRWSGLLREGLPLRLGEVIQELPSISRPVANDGRR